MTWNDISLLLAVLGAASLSAAWLGRKSDDMRDSAMMTVIGGVKLALALGVWVTIAE